MKLNQCLRLSARGWSTLLLRIIFWSFIWWRVSAWPGTTHQPAWLDSQPKTSFLPFWSSCRPWDRRGRAHRFPPACSWIWGNRMRVGTRRALFMSRVCSLIRYRTGRSRTPWPDWHWVWTVPFPPRPSHRLPRALRKYDRGSGIWWWNPRGWYRWPASWSHRVPTSRRCCTRCSTALSLHCCTILACIWGFRRRFRSSARRSRWASGSLAGSSARSIPAWCRSSSGTSSLSPWTCRPTTSRVIIWRRICPGASGGAPRSCGWACSGRGRIWRNRPIFTWVVYFEILLGGLYRILMVIVRWGWRECWTRRGFGMKGRRGMLMKDYCIGWRW